jgi:hypothetical protein
VWGLVSEPEWSQTVSTYRPGDIRTLDKGRVLILHSNLLPILVRTVDVEQCPDWPQLRADVAAIRGGTLSITDQGYSQTPALATGAKTLSGGGEAS